MAGSFDQVFMFTAAAVSPGVSAGELLTSLIVFCALYAALMVVEVRLLWRYTRGGVAAAMPELAQKHDDDGEHKQSDDVLAFAY
jgi:cytochrome d ubiquinol oxidase subunit I